MRTAIPADAFQHGDAKRYRRGCRCRQCVTAVSAEARKNRYLRATGRGARVAPAHAAAHIRTLRSAGMSDTAIISAASIADDTFYRVLRGLDLRRATEHRILAVPVPAHGNHRNGALTPGLGTFRRLRALSAEGWTASELGCRADRTKQFIVYLQHRSDDAVVRSWVAEDIRDLYQDLSTLRPESHGVPPHRAETTRRRAAEKGWAGAAYWDDEDFDNPDFTPATRDSDLNFAQLGRHRRTEIAHLASFGTPEQEIADRLAMPPKYVRDILRGMRQAVAA